MNEKDPERQVHYCNTCRHGQKLMIDAPCRDCIPGLFGGPDRWEAKESQHGIMDKGVG